MILWPSCALLSASAALGAAQLAVVYLLLWSMPPLVADTSAPRLPRPRRPIR
ncbi:hypothetical protein [Kitasatospora sp. NPDC017646]|uniref:hypothetical protein n=1 Tax=Kitasatospora sp. NPDC017646 TaxID=3364024 RepID=UPI0037AD9BCD